MYCKTIKLNSTKWKKYPFYEDKGLVGLTPGQIRLGSGLEIKKFEIIFG
jgi:hypothetical protein